MIRGRLRRHREPHAEGPATEYIEIDPGQLTGIIRVPQWLRDAGMLSWLLLGIGLLGFLMRRYNIPVAPVLIAVILGPLAETELRRALSVSQGDLGILVDSPITITLYAVLAVVLAVSVIQHLRGRRSRGAVAAEPREKVDA